LQTTAATLVLLALVGACSSRKLGAPDAQPGPTADAAADRSPDVTENRPDAAPAADVASDAVDAATIGLTGATVSMELRSPLDRPVSAKLSAAVGPEVEFPNVESHALGDFVLVPADVDVSAASIEIRFHPPVAVTLARESFNGYVFAFVPPGPVAIKGASIDPGSSLEGRGARATFDATGVTVDLAGLMVGPETKLIVALSF
jgi:hypothetical protein